MARGVSRHLIVVFLLSVLLGSSLPLTAPDVAADGHCGTYPPNPSPIQYRRLDRTGWNLVKIGRVLVDPATPIIQVDGVAEGDTTLRFFLLVVNGVPFAPSISSSQTGFREGGSGCPIYHNGIVVGGAFTKSYDVRDWLPAAALSSPLEVQLGITTFYGAWDVTVSMGAANPTGESAKIGIPFLSPGFNAARDRAPATPGCGLNTFGYTTDSRCGPSLFALDWALQPGNRQSIHVDMGDFGAWDHMPGSLYSYRVGMAAQIQGRLAYGETADLVSIALNGVPVGMLRYQQGLCFTSSAFPGQCGPAVRIPAGMVALGNGKSTLTYEILKNWPTNVEAINPAYRIRVDAVAIELAAPPTYILHGWLPTAKGTCGGPEGDTAYGAYRPKLAADLRSRSLDLFGQDPWGHFIMPSMRVKDHGGAPAYHEGINPHWTYCTKDAFDDVAGSFAASANNMRVQTGYTGDVWILAHSMGGLVARWNMEVLGTKGVPVERLVTIGTPHHGSCYGFGLMERLFVLANPGLKGAYNNNKGWFSLDPSSPEVLRLAVAHRTDASYHAIAGNTPNAMLCGWGAPQEGKDGDFIVATRSGRFIGDPSIDDQIVNCASHADGFGLQVAGIPLYNDHETRARIAEDFFGGEYAYPGPGRSADACALIAGVKLADKAISKGSALKKKYEPGVKRFFHDAGRFFADNIILLSNVDGSNTDDAATIGFHHAGDAAAIRIDGAGDMPRLAVQYPDGSSVDLDSAQAAGDADLLVDPPFWTITWNLSAAAPGAYALKIAADLEDEFDLDFAVLEEGRGSVSVEIPAPVAGGPVDVRGTVRVDGLEPEDSVQVEAVWQGDAGFFPATTQKVGSVWEAGGAQMPHGLYDLLVNVTIQRAEGGHYERQAAATVYVPPAIDWSLTTETLQGPFWWGSDVAARFTACRPDASEGVDNAGIIVEMAGEIRAAHRFVSSEPGCHSTNLTWVAESPGTSNVRATLAADGFDPDGGNNEVGLVVDVVPSRATRLVLEGQSRLDGTYQGQVNLTLHSHLSDGVAYPTFVAVDGIWIPYVGPVKEDRPGNHTVQFFAIDATGAGIEPMREVTFEIRD